jgi:hypothetical protein
VAFKAAQELLMVLPAPPLGLMGAVSWRLRSGQREAVEVKLLPLALAAILAALGRPNLLVVMAATVERAPTLAEEAAAALEGRVEQATMEDLGT